jgi:hypothetical protein
MSASSYFTSLAAKLTALQTAIDDLDAAETGLRTKPPTSTSADRDGKLNVAKGQLRVLRDNVQEIADADIENAETIIIAAGLKVKKIGSITRPDFAVKLTGLSGQVELVAKGNPDSRGAHEWGMRKIGDEWTSLPVTVHASTIISDLIPGDEMEFRHRAVLPEGKTDWQEETIRIM